MRELGDIKKLVRGMILDVDPVNMPPDAYRLALNATVESKEGDLSARSSETGNRVFKSVNGRVVGTLLLNNNQTLYFIEQDSSSKLSLLDEEGNETILVVSTCLNFTTANPIQAEYRILNGCERVIYFTDSVNRLRTINIDNLEQYTQLDANGVKYSVAYANANDAWECSLFNYSPEFLGSQLNTTIIEGGSLRHGNYCFTYRYLDGDFNPTDWEVLTYPRLVTETRHGGIFDFATTPGYTASKSIGITLVNPDAKYPYVQFGVAQWTMGNDYEYASYALEILSTNQGNPVQFTYYNTEQAVEILTERDFSVRSVKIKQAKTLTSLDERLYIGNTTDTTYDWAAFQRTASQIVVNFHQSPDTQTFSLNSFLMRGFMRDEIYSLGVVYRFKDGTESPVFHIPGRPLNQAAYFDGANIQTLNNADLIAWGNANAPSHGWYNGSAPNRNQVPAGQGWDDQLLTIITNTAANDTTQIHVRNTLHVSDKPSANQVYRHQVYNTAVSIPGTRDYIPAYYAADTSYLDLRDCNGDSIWGTDFWGNDLLGENIRHHKTPSTDISAPFEKDPVAPTTRDKEVYPLVAYFYNVTIPAQYINDVEGFYFVRQKRTAGSMTVLDTGYGIATDRTGVEQFSPDFFTSSGTETIVRSYFTPKAIFNSELKKGAYLQNEAELLAVVNTSVLRPYISGNTWHEDRLRTINDYLYVDPFAGDFFRNSQVGRSVFNNTACKPIFYELENSLFGNIGDPTRDNHYVRIKTYIKPYGNIFNAEYVTASLFFYAVNQPFYVGHGDCFISRLDVKAQIAGNGQSGLVLDHLYCESTINSELRSPGIAPWETLFLNTNTSEYLSAQNDQGDYVSGYVQYLTQYSMQQDVNKFYTLPANYDYCLDCNNKFPTRIWVSEKATQEEREDAYRKILPNSYLDLSSDTGELISLLSYKQAVFGITEYSSYGVPIAPQELEATGNTVFVGTGGPLSQPARKLVEVDRGYAGTQHRLASIVTEHGAVWVDAMDGKVFLFQEGFKELSTLGMRAWFASNLPIKKKTYLTGYSLYDSITHINGVGIQVVYDPRHSRVHIVKKDWDIVDENWRNATSTKFFTEGVLHGFCTSEQEFYTWPTGAPSYTLVDVVNTKELTKNLSFTVTYSFGIEGWESFKSYRPNYMWHDRTRLFTTINSYAAALRNRVWVHDSKNDCYFYNVEHPFMLEVVFNDGGPVTKVFNSFRYNGKVMQYDFLKENYKDLLQAPFDYMYAYNSYQSTGFKAISQIDLLNPFSSINYEAMDSVQVVYSEKNENYWSVSGLKDFTIGSTPQILSNDWNDLTYRDERSTHGIVYSIADSDINFSKNIFETPPLRDLYLVVRLYQMLTTDTPKKVVIDFIKPNVNVSFK